MEVVAADGTCLNELLGAILNILLNQNGNLVNVFQLVSLCARVLAFVRASERGHIKRSGSVQTIVSTVLLRLLGDHLGTLIMRALVYSKQATILVPVSRSRHELLTILLGRRDLEERRIGPVSALLESLTLLRGRLVQVVRPVERVIIVVHFGTLARRAFVGCARAILLGRRRLLRHSILLVCLLYALLCGRLGNDIGLAATCNLLLVRLLVSLLSSRCLHRCLERLRPFRGSASVGGAGALTLGAALGRILLH